MHDAVRSVWKCMLKRVVQLCGAASVIVAVVGLKHWIYGLLFGSAIGLINFYLIGKRVSETVEKKKSSNRILIGYFFRFVILALSFVVVARYDAVYIAPFVIGVLLVQIALYIDYVWGYKQHE